MCPQLGHWGIWQPLNVVEQEEVGGRPMIRAEKDLTKVPLITSADLVVARRRTNLNHISSNWDMAKLTNLLTGATRHITSINPAPMGALSLNYGPAAWKHLRHSEMLRLWTKFTDPHSH